MSVLTQKKPVHFQTFLYYSILFLIVAAFIFTPFFIEGKTFIWEGDGFHQHYPFFREYLTILRQFFETGEWQNWDWNIGVGADTLIHYGYYVVGDPFVYIGLLFPEGSEELAFHIAMLVRIWCVGASFLLYARKMKFSHQSALATSLMYAFSHYVIYNVVRHPFFIHPLIFFPLLALGIEKIFNKESGVFFVLVIAASAMSNFYFFYMLTWMIFLYALIRYIFGFKEKSWSNFFKWFAYFLVLYLIGLLIASVIFVPLVYGFLNASRSPNFPPVSLFIYPLHYYGLLFINSITPGTIFWTVGGLSVVSVLSLPFLFNRRDNKPGLVWVLVILSIMLLFPFFGSLMNGLSGPYNRFTFVFPFYLAIALAYLIDHSQDLRRNDLVWTRRLMVAFTILYVAASFVEGIDMVIFYMTPVVIGWLMYILLSKRAKNEINPLPFNRWITVLIALNVTINALNFYLPYGKHAMSETEDYGTIDETHAKVFAGLEKELPDDEWYRVGVSSKDNHVRNQYPYIDTPGTTSYASLSNGAIADFSRLIESSAYQIIQPLRNGVDDRRVVNQALGIRYILTDEENANYLPPGYTINTELSDEQAGMIVAETDHEAPFAYLETDSIALSEVEDLHPVQRESLLAQAVILDEKTDLQVSGTEIPEITTHEGEWHFKEAIAGPESFSLNESVELTASEDDAQMTLTFENPEDLVDQEVFIYFEGIEFDPPASPLLAQDSTQFRLRVMYNNQEKSVLQSDRYSFSSYFKRDNMLIHLNEVTEAEETLTVQFDDAGHYSFEKISVVSRPSNEEEMATAAEEKNNQAFEIQNFSNERIEGAINADGSGMLVTHIPYTRGWQAYVNGQEVDTEKVNAGFIGVPLTAGEHEITFVYQTPYIKAGLMLTLVGLGGLSAYIVFYNKRRDE